MLDDESSVLESAEKPDTDSRQLDRVLQSARSWSRLLQSEVERTAALTAIMDRVELKGEGMSVSIKLPLEKSRAQLAGEVAMTRSFPM